jgi:hypothetical protein
MQFLGWTGSRGAPPRNAFSNPSRRSFWPLWLLTITIALMSQSAFAISVTSFSPTSGNVGTSVTINGTGYSTTLTNNTVKFNGTVATVTSATTIKIIATVPSGATTGRITVTVSGVTATSSTDFTVKPQVTGFTPGSGPVGTPITVQGEGFSPTPANNVVTLHGTTATVTSASATALAIAVPAGATTGTIKVVVGSFSSTSTASFTVTPSITGFSPDNGVYNTPVTITGYNFSTTRTNNTVAFGGVAASVTSATATQLVAPVPYAAVSGPITVTVAGSTATSTQSFSVTLSLTGLMQWYGSEGDHIDLYGTGFSPVVADNTVDFNGVPAVVISATATQVTVEVPPGATTGPVHSTSGGQSATTDGDFTIQPKITSFSPESGLVGSTVNINGVDFSAAASANIVKFGPVAATILTASPTLLTVVVPSGAGNGPLLVSTAGQGALSTDSFTVTPQFLSFSPTSGPAGFTSVTITGEGFSLTPQDNVVTINGVAATVTNAHTQQLVVSVPVNATTGLIQVTVSGTTLTSAQPFTVAPQITSFAPGSGPVGTSVTLQGYGFSATPSANLVTFGGVAATVTSASATQLTVTVPSGANTGYIQVTVNGGTGHSSAGFVVTASGNTVAIDGPSTQASTTVAGQNIVLTFNGTAGQFLGLGISMSTSPTSARPTVAITGPSGTVAPDTLCVTACSFDLGPLPATGTYTITANPHASATMSLVATLSTDVTGTIAPGSPFNLGMPRPGQIARLDFQGTVGDIEALEFSNLVIVPSGETVLMQVQRPDGSPFVDLTPLGRTPLVQLPANGTYKLIIKRLAAASSIATTIALAPPVNIDIDGAMVDEDARYSGNGNVGLLTFTATAGQQLGLGLVLVPDYGYCCDATEDASFFVLAPDGTIAYAPDRIDGDGFIVIAHSCSNFTGYPGCSGAFTAEQSGTYTIYVTPTHFHATLSTPQTGQLILNGPAFVYSPRPGQLGSLTFAGVAGQNLQIQWDATTWSPDGSYVSVTSPDGSELTEFVVPQSGHVPGVAYLPTLPATGTYVLNFGICCAQVTYWPAALATQSCPPPYAGPAPSRTTITSVAPNPVTLNGSYTVSVDVWTCAGDYPVGSVTVLATVGDDPNIVGNCSFDTAVATSCTIQALVGGPQQLLAKFIPSDPSSVQSSTGGATVSVSQGQSSVAIGQVIPAVSSIGQNYAVYASAAPVPPTGSALSGSILVSDGVGSCTITLPATACYLTTSSAGVVRLSAIYSGDAAHAGSSAPPVFHAVSGAGGAMPTGVEVCGFNPSNTLQDPPGFVGLGSLTGSIPSAGVVTDIVGSYPLAVEVSAPIDGYITGESNVDVVGTYVGPMNTGIAINGVTGNVMPDGTFLVPRVPLEPGSNVLDVEATTLPGATASTSITVVRQGTPNPVSIDTDFQGGLAPASVMFHYGVGPLPNGGVIQSIGVDYTNDGSVDATAADLAEIPNYISFNLPGIYTLRLIVTDTNNVTYTAFRSVLVQDLTTQRSVLCDVYGYLKDRLNAQDAQGASLAYSDVARDQHLALFEALGTDMPSIVSQLGTIGNGHIGQGYAELDVLRDNADQTRSSYPLRMARGADGVWRISEM